MYVAKKIITKSLKIITVLTILQISLLHIFIFVKHQPIID